MRTGEPKGSPVDCETGVLPCLRAYFAGADGAPPLPELLKYLK
jgi:hypothetical protein